MNKYRNILIIFWIAFFAVTCKSTIQKNNPANQWVGTWYTSQQLVEPHNLPPEPGLSHNTLRQIVRVSIGGETVRLKLANSFTSEPVEIKEISIAASISEDKVDVNSLKLLEFEGEKSTIIPAYGEVYSDPVAYDLVAGSLLAITIHFGEVASDITGHPGSRTTSYLTLYNQAASPDFEDPITTDHWYMINGVEVYVPADYAAIAVLGNSITDGRGSGTNKQNRWTDILSERLLKNEETKNIAVLNMGIGGNCVLRGGLGPTALERFEKDILLQPNLRWLIILEGINDIGSAQSEEDAEQVAIDLIDAYRQMIKEAHSKGILVYGATILPFSQSFYDAPFRQSVRDKVNEWIRNSTQFDAVIDFDKMMQDEENNAQIQADMHDGDFLHPNEGGYRRMGERIDLNLFR